MSLTKISNNSLSAISTLPASIPTGALTLLSTQTASSSASIEFTSGIDSTYSSYIFKFIDIHVSNDGVNFNFNMSIDGGSTYAVTKTTTFFYAYHNEAGTTTALTYAASNDLAQSTSDQIIGAGIGSVADESASGTLQLFNPSSTTFVKHFISTMTKNSYNDFAINDYVAGYGNTTSAINAIKFLAGAGTFDGIIKMYGVS